MHIPGRTNPADLLTGKTFKFLGGPSPALYTGYNEPDSVLKLFTATVPAPAFVHSGQEPTATQHPRFLHADFASALRAAGCPSTRSGDGTPRSGRPQRLRALPLPLVLLTRRRIVVLSFCRTGCYIAVARVVIDSASPLRARCASRS